jgi:predicted peptidase
MPFKQFVTCVFIVVGTLTYSNLYAAEQTAQKAVEKEIKIVTKVKFFLALPDDYDKSTDKFPLIVFLHGAGEQGDDLNMIKRHGMPKLLAAGQKFPFIVASPQSPVNVWQPQVLNAFIDDIAATYKVDESRIYLTGISMGGFGTWNYAVTYPNRCAAIVPICGGGDPKQATKLAKLPVWAFHGAMDDRVPIVKTAEMIKAIEDVGGQPKFTIYPDAKHDSWTKSYENPELFKWLLEQNRKPASNTK